MIDTFRPAAGWGPGRHRAALAITFDNFGEAAEIETGRWKAGEIGKHYTAGFLPRLMDVLGDVKATYFMEASNAAYYPDAIKGWAAAGHEVALHGWRHEMWMQTPAERRVALLAESKAAMRGLGLDLVGFRPPGGGMPPEAWDELAAVGIRYCSAAGPQGVGRIGEVVSLPFEWRAVDAFMIEPVLGFLRAMMGEPEVPYSVVDWASNLKDMLGRLIARGEQRTLIFHPEFLGRADDKLAVLGDFVALARQEDIWIAPARDIAAFVADELDLPVMQAA